MPSHSLFEKENATQISRWRWIPAEANVGIRDPKILR
jgi:hypothetical protein